MTRRIAGVMLLLLLGAGPAAGTLDEAGEAAAALLRTAVTPRQDGAHEALLESLRRMRDPTLLPLFGSLINQPAASLKLQGMLGAAELDPAYALPISVIGEMESAPMQAELIVAALDDKLIAPADAQQMLTWPGMNLSVKLMIAAQQMSVGQFNDASLPAEALKSPRLGQRGFGALLLHQLKDPRGATALGELDQSTEPTRDAVRAELLRMMVRNRFERAADWAAGIAGEPNVDEALQWAAMAAAMRFGHKSATSQWTRVYQASGDNAAQQRLLALMALRVAPFIEAGTFDVMLSSDDPMVVQIGRTGKAIATDAPDLATQATTLLAHAHPMVNGWALAFSANDARPDVAQIVLMGVIAAYDAREPGDRLKWLNDVARAALQLMELDPVVGANLLRPILASPNTDTDLQLAIVLGLLRVVGVENVSGVIEGITFKDTDTSRLALVLRARDGATLSDAEMKELRWIVRGATKIQSTLRIQAAWNYLKRTNQIDAALQAALQP